MGKVKIRLTQQAYIEGYEGAFLREHDVTGKRTGDGVFNNWYTALAEDDDGNEYRVFWKLRPDYNPEITDDEGDACDWDHPWMVLDEEDRNVKEYVYIGWFY